MDTPKLRLLPRSEWGRLQQVFYNFNSSVPNNGHIVVAESLSKIVGFECLHQESHIGPVYVDPKFRGSGLWPRMQEMCEAQLKPGDYFYQYGSVENEKRLASFGLLPLGWTLWGKRIEAANKKPLMRGVSA